MKPNVRLLSLDEVNAILPEVEILMTRMDKTRKKHEGLHDALLMHEILSDAERARGLQSTEHTIEEDAREIETVLAELEKDIARIRDLGGVIRSLEFGWIDFPGEYQGKTICFSWKFGEKTIQYYANQNAMLKDRLPIR